MLSRNGYYRPQVINVTLANLLLFITMVSTPMGVFTVPIERAAPSLRAVWSSGLGMGLLLGAAAISLTGFILDTRKLPVTADQEHPITKRIHNLALPISSVYFTLMLAVPAIDSSSAFLLRSSALLLDIPSGVSFILTIETLLVWMPRRPGLAMTLVSAGFGLSQFILSPILTISISVLGLRATLLGTAITAFLATFLCLRFLSFPTQRDMAEIGTPTSASDGNIELLPSSSANGPVSQNILTWSKLLRMPQFYLYLVVTFTGRTAQSLLPYYFKLGHVFGLSTSSVVLGFQALSILGIFYAFAVNSLMEHLSSSYRSAARLLLSVVFFIQVGLCLLMIPVSKAYNGWAALTITSCLIVMLESQTAFSVILARDIFGKKNSALVFGVAGGLSIGVGGCFFTTLLAAIELYGDDKVSTPDTFLRFWPLAAFTSLIGGFCVLSMHNIRTAHVQTSC